jgi:hypothetical protein
LIPELAVEHGNSRIDLASIGDSLDGFEIKSRWDDLRRLPRQVAAYGRVFDRVSLVIDPHHLSSARAAVPEWWGILVADSRTDAIGVVRAAGWNPGPQALAIASLLWVEELREALLPYAQLPGRATAHALRKELVASLAHDDLRTLVRSRLTTRRGWRAA